MGMRRRAREIALQVLYQMDAQPELAPEAAFARVTAHLLGDAGDPASGQAPEPAPTAEMHAFIERLVRGVHANLAEIDALLTRASHHWRLERMARVDRNLLRLAAYEMRFCDDIPAKVAINEAIEIAKRFGAQETPAFVNGVLDRLLEGA
jgi:N utilization substance protein B